MGQLISLFPQSNPRKENPLLRREQRIRLNFIENSIKSLELEEMGLKQAINQKCHEEISRLKSINLRLSQLESEAERIISGAVKLNNS